MNDTPLPLTVWATRPRGLSPGRLDQFRQRAVEGGLVVAVDFARLQAERRQLVGDVSPGP